MQRYVNDHDAEPMTAILPGVALQEVWEIVGAAEKTLFAVSVLVVVVGLAGMLVALLTSLNERRREMAVLRSVGARPVHVFALILGEAGFLTGLGIVAPTPREIMFNIEVAQLWLLNADLQQIVPDPDADVSDEALVRVGRAAMTRTSRSFEQWANRSSRS